MSVGKKSNLYANTDRHTRMAEHFLYAGISALLLATPHFYPQAWFLSLFALIPFLWRVVNVRFSESIILGALLAGSYCFVIASPVSWVLSANMVFKLLALSLLFAVYAATVNRIARHIGLNAIFIAVLWLPLEYTLNQIAFVDQILAFPQESSGLIMRVGTMFGMLMVSFVIMLTNLLILILIKEVMDALQSGAELHIERIGRPCSPADTPLSQEARYRFATPRAPPQN